MTPVSQLVQESLATPAAEMPAMHMPARHPLRLSCHAAETLAVHCMLADKGSSICQGIEAALKV